MPDYSLYSLYSCSQPYNRYTLTGSVGSTCSITPVLNGVFSNGDSGTLYFVVKKNGQLIGSKTITVNNTSVTISGAPITKTVTVLDEIEIGFYIDDTKVYQNSESLLHAIAQTANKVAVASYSGSTNVDIYKQSVNLYHRAYPTFGTMYRQWGQFMYNPGAVTGAQPLSGLPGYLMKEEALVISEQTASDINDAAESLEDAGFEDYNLDTDYAAFETQLTQFQNSNSALFNTGLIPARPQRDYINGIYDERWTGMHAESYTTAAAYRAAMLDQVFDGIDGGSDDITQGVLQTGAYAIKKYSKGSGKNLSGGFSVGFQEAGATVGISGSKSLDGNNHSLTEYIDMNGDKYPDVVSTEKIQLTTRTGGLYGQQNLNGNFNGDLGTSASNNWGIGASGSFYKGSKETVGSKGAAQTKQGAQIKNAYIKSGGFDMFSGSSSIGISGSFSKGNDDASKMWLDLNGDGLADLLQKSGQIMSVKMNAGNNLYTAAQQGTSWANFNLNEGSGTAFGGGIGYSYKNGSIEAGYSLGKTISDSKNTLIDINADGLPDLIHSSNDHFYVQLNDGNGFVDTQLWANYSLYKSAQVTKSSLNIGATAAWVWWLFIPPLPPIPLKIPAVSVKSSYGTSTNNTKKTVTDFDGDGFPDLLQETSSGHIKVRPSRIRRTDKLKMVHNPLGGSFTVNYEVIRPTYNNPSAKWVMSDLVVEDGYDYANDGADAYWKKFEYENARYDRREREFYGFETVKTIDNNIDENGNIESVYRTGVTVYENSSYFLNGLVKESYVLKGDDESQIFSKTINSYSIWEINYTTGLLSSLVGSSFDTGGTQGRKGAGVLLSKTDNFLYEFGTDPITRSVSIKYDNYGRVLAYFDSAGTGPDDNYQTNITYHTPATTSLLSRNILNIPSEIRVLHGSDLLRNRKTEVDPNTGSVIKVLTYYDPSNFYETSMTYDSCGNLKNIIYPNMSYVYTYDETEENKYVIATEDAYGYQSFASYNPRFDKPNVIMDISGNMTQYGYDRFGRTRVIQGPKEVNSGIPYTIRFYYYPAQYQMPTDFDCYEPKAPFTPFAITQHYDRLRPSNPIETITLIDGLARPVQVKKDIEMNMGDQQNPVLKERMSVSGTVAYDWFGRPLRQRQSWHEKKCDINYIYNDYDTGYYAESEYDILDGPVKLMDAEGNISENKYSLEEDYFGNVAACTKSTADQNGSEQIIAYSYKDMAGRVTSTKNILSGNGGSDDIWTRFQYSAAGDLVQYTDNEDISTSYKYDLMGRKTMLNHPDNGVTTYYYDQYTNLEKVQTSNLLADTNLQPADQYIKYKYDHARITNIDFPNPQPGVLNVANVEYSYGGTGTGNNTGRLISQTDATGQQTFEYGFMGEVTNNTRIVQGPNIPTRTFTTAFNYDAFGRILGMTYPDGEKVKYSYDKGGNLYSISGTVNGNAYSYVKRIEYDYFEQRTYLLYGNNTGTYYTYTPEIRRLDNMTVNTSTQEAMLNNTYKYDKVGNIMNVENNALSNSVTAIGGSYGYKFSYDNLNRLIETNGSFTGDISQQENNNDTSADFGLSMRYNTTHGILRKTQEHIKNGTFVDANSYSNSYAYFEGTHKLQMVEGANNTAEYFDYDANGNITKNYDFGTLSRNHLWDESNRLRVVEDHTAQTMQHYIYDASGERVLKGSAYPQLLYENGMTVGSTQSFDAYTTYPSGYIVVDGQGSFTKHYYAGSQRIVSRLGETTADIFNTQPTAPRYAAPGAATGSNKFDPEKLKHQQIADLAFILKKMDKGTPVFKDFKVATDEDAGQVNDSIKKPKPAAATVAAPMAAMAPPPEQFPYAKIYFYHPDHLGTSTYITDANGLPYQFFINLPFGETMAEQHSLTEDYETPYKFNGKELDTETGYYYYGARYYKPNTSIWVSVDPLAQKYPNVNSYVYCLQNPINLVDPDGRDVIGWLFKKGSWARGVVSSSLAKPIRYFMRSKYGKNFISQFMNKGDKAFGYEASENGKYSNYDLHIKGINEGDGMERYVELGGFNDGYFHPTIDANGKLVFTVAINTSDGRSNRNFNSVLEDIIHEMALHGYSVDEIIKKYKELGPEKWSEWWVERHRNEKGEKIVNDHIAIKANDESHKGVKTYNEVINELSDGDPTLHSRAKHKRQSSYSKYDENGN